MTVTENDILYYSVIHGAENVQASGHQASEDKNKKAAEKPKEQKMEEKVEKEEKEEKEEEFDLFGGDDEDDEAHEQMIMKRAAEANAKKEAARVAAGKQALVAKSAVLFDVKPWEADTDMVSLERDIRAISMDGLEWKAGELKPVAFGVKKLVIMAHIEDEKVSTDDLEDKIRELEDYVQSVDIASFSKL